MKHDLHTEIDIEAPPEQVLAILTAGFEAMNAALKTRAESDEQTL
jgi:hypothetical protein